MLELMSKLVNETRDNNLLIRQHFSPTHAKSPNHFGELKDKTNIVAPKDMENTMTTIFAKSPKKNDLIIEEVEETPSGHNLRPIKLKTSGSTAGLALQRESNPMSNMEKILKDLTKKLETSEQINKKLLSRLENLENEKLEKKAPLISSKKQLKDDDYSMISKALGDKIQDESS